MNAQPQEKTRMTPEAYLELERASLDIKHEYFDGEIFAMTGASVNHNRINFNISGELRAQLKGHPCDAFASDMRVKVNALEKYTYPDIVMTCGNIEVEKIKGVETLLNPVAIMEVLSSSTEAYDRGKKFQHYQLLPTLQEYVLVSQCHCLVEKYIRNDDGSWNLTSYGDMAQSVEIESADCKLMLSEIYYRVEFEDGTESTNQ